MAWKSFAMVAERAPGETDWSVKFPQFPGVTSVAEERGQIFSQACDALASAVDDLAEAGEAIPRCRETAAWRRGQVLRPTARKSGSSPSSRSNSPSLGVGRKVRGRAAVADRRGDGAVRRVRHCAGRARLRGRERRRVGGRPGWDRAYVLMVAAVAATDAEA